MLFIYTSFTTTLFPRLKRTHSGKMNCVIINHTILLLNH